jgi:hypothetical protein
MSHAHQLVWHYTVRPKVVEIHPQGVLTPFGKPGQVEAVWFSTQQLWEPTAACNWLGQRADGTVEFLDMAALYRFHGGLFRFGVVPETAPVRWEEYRNLVTRDVAEAMLEGAIELGADPGCWRASLDPVLQDRWAAVDRWNGKVWERLGKTTG